MVKNENPAWATRWGFWFLGEYCHFWLATFNYSKYGTAYELNKIM
jgi:hypothetical protein